MDELFLLVAHSSNFLFLDMRTTYPTYIKSKINDSHQHITPGVIRVNIAASVKSPIAYTVQSLNKGNHVKVKTSLEYKTHMPITNNTLKTALPTIVPKPTSLSRK